LLERNSKPAPAISPYDAADSREIELLEQSPEKLSYSYPLFPPGRVRSVISTILTGILTLWWGFAAVLFASSLTGLGKAGPNALPLILPLMLVIPSMPLALILLVVTRGRTTVSITRDQLSCRRH